jgi:hypothetical protein
MRSTDAWAITSGVMQGYSVLTSYPLWQRRNGADTLKTA